VLVSPLPTSLLLFQLSSPLPSILLFLKFSFLGVYGKTFRYALLLPGVSFRGVDERFPK
jgi:hypothetical protein